MRICAIFGKPATKLPNYFTHLVLTRPRSLLKSIRVMACGSKYPFSKTFHIRQNVNPFDKMANSIWPSRQACWNFACLSCNGLSLNPVYLAWNDTSILWYEMCVHIYIYFFFFNHNSWRHATFALEGNYCKSIRFPPKLFFGDISSFSGKFPMNVWISTAYYLSAFFPCNCYWRFLSFPYTVSSFFSIVVFQGGS